MKRLSFVALACILFFRFSLHAASPVVISEFMASNSRTLLDEAGQYSDWIEIHNVSSNTVDLINWSLTDSAGNLTKWRFPATNLNAGQFMVIFASSPERRVPGAPLHTDFALSANGEYLALVDPNGVIASQFAPAFPPQAPDVSFGMATLTTNQTVITTNSLVRVLVPASGDDGTNWTTAGYNDSAWTLGTNGVGFGTTNATAADYGAAVLPTAPVGFWRFSEGSGTTVVNLGSGVGLDGTATATATVATGPRPPQLNGFEANNNARNFNGSSAYVGVNSSLLNNRGAFTIGGWVRKAVAQAARTGLFGQNDCVEFGFISDGMLECWTPGGGSLDAPVTLSLNTWYHILAVGNGSNIRIFTNGVLAGTGGAATASYGSSADRFNIGGNGIFDTTGNFFNGQIDEVVAYHRALTTNEIRALYDGGRFPASVPVTPFVKTDISAVMSNINASAYIRLPFTINDPTNVSQLTLRVRYDDGFVAFLNGIPVASANAPAELAFNSAATSAHSPGVVEEFRFRGTALQAGANVLAIQGLNMAATNEDFLVQVELTTTAVAAESSTPLYFTTPSPGAENVGGVANPGPAILDVTHSPNVPLDDDDLVVTARIAPTFYPLATVVMRYRVMLPPNPELEVTMFDDGAHGDGAANDGVYGAIIPASASTNGQMVRWYFRTTDILGNASRWPLFADPANSAEYLGTVVNPGYVTSKLPVFHLFAPTNVLQPPRITPPTQQIGADSENGGRVSIFYDGEFYDNVYMELRGNTSAGQNKKSHRLEFNREHTFRHLPGFPRVRKTSLMAEFLDPAYLRQHLCFWLLEQMGVPSPFFYPVRAQLNGSFYALTFHNDVIDEEQVARMGYDPAGALYKAVGNALPSESSTGVFQKKGPPPLTDHTDYQTLVRAINETNTPPGQATNLTLRRIAAYDMLDIPEVVNYLAGARWCAENDDVWANMSIYRDTYGDGLWRIIPFDMNASWGQRYGGITPLDAIADNCKSHPLYGGSTIIACDGGTYNRIYDTIIALPETRQMLLRRQRTILDRWVMEPGVAPESRLLETHIRYMTNLIWTEAFLDRAGWGYSSWTASNKPLTNAVNELFNEFINLRRIHFSATHNITNVAKPIGITPTSNAGIPLSQPANAFVTLHSVEFSPSSGDQEQEFVCITNTTGLALEISGWRLEGAVNFTFAQGTIVPPFTALYASPNVKAFRARTTGPRGGQGLFVVGPYSGRLSARGETVRLINGLGIQLQELTYAGSPSLAQQFLRVTELMYNPSPLAGNTNDAQEFEYIELMNISTNQSIDLTGVRFINGIEFDFTNSGLNDAILPPGQRVALVKNGVAFGDRYGWNAPAVVGQYTGSLDNGGERVRLVDAVGEEILDFTYNNSWYPLTDGHGFSLVVVDKNAEPDAWGRQSQWRAGFALPSFDDPPLPAVAPVFINELLSASVFPQTDWIELHNPNGNAVDVSGWFITDDFATARKFVIPPGTVLQPGGFKVFTEADFNPGGTGFAFSSDNDEAWLFSADATGNLTGYAHGLHFGAAEPGVSFGRYVTSTGGEHFVAQATQTSNTANAGPKVGPIVINEIMYRPPDIGTGDNSGDEFIELLNISNVSVPLFDPGATTNTWRLTEGVDFSFPTNVTLAAGEFALVVNFNPTDAAALATFQAKYGVAAGVKIFGPYGGQLDNSGERIELKKPNPPVAGKVSYPIVDEVDYRDSAPWPAGADGFGLSLQRINAGAYGDDPVNWQASIPTAGAPSTSGGTAPSVTAQPSGQSVLLGSDVLLSVSATGTAPLFYQWRFNGMNLPGATSSFLALSAIQAEQAGTYSLVAYNASGSQVSSNAFVNVILPAFIGSHPQSVTLRGSTNSADYGFTGANATFSASAASLNGTVTYQWRFNGVNIPGATSPVLTITGVNLSHDGIYDVVVTDAISSALSNPARLTVLLTPIIIKPPVSQTVVEGSDFTMSVEITGNPLPIAYSWRRGSIVVATNFGNYRSNFITLNATAAGLILTNNILSSNYTMRLVVYNQANNSPGVLASFTNTVLADFDRDGIPDVVENSLGLSPNNPADAAQDLDGDGMSNRAEYLAGTDPTNAASYLRIVQGITAGTATVQVAAVSNRTYTVQFTDNLNSGAWIRLADIVARSSNRVETFTDPAWTTNRFYRVVLPRQP